MKLKMHVFRKKTKQVFQIFIKCKSFTPVLKLRAVKLISLTRNIDFNNKYLQKNKALDQKLMVGLQNIEKQNLLLADDDLPDTK